MRSGRCHSLSHSPCTIRRSQFCHLMRATWLPSVLAGIWRRKIWLLPVATWFPTHWILWWAGDVLIFSDEPQQVHQGKNYPRVFCAALASAGWSWNKLGCVCLRELSVLICGVPAPENKKILNPMVVFALHETPGLLWAAVITVARPALRTNRVTELPVSRREAQQETFQWTLCL